MEKKNYNSMYKSKVTKKPNEEIETAPVEELSNEEVETTNVEEKVIKVELKEPEVVKLEKSGIVTGGLNLNVRKNPNGEIIDAIPTGTKVTITDDKGDWYAISSPVSGFVMKKFIQV